MITKPTVLILGAGASMPYGYPSGKEMLESVVHDAQNDHDWKGALFGCGMGEHEIQKFCSELSRSQLGSVDAFLEHRPEEFMKIGKLTIALSIMTREIEDNMLPLDARYKGIYPYLFEKLNSKLAELSHNKISIITFNYDRSLEHYLYTAIKHTFIVPDEAIAEIIKSFNILHVHGCIGPLPWQETGGRPYGTPFSLGLTGPEREHFLKDVGSQNLRAAAERIIIVSEGNPSSKEFELARETISNAERIYFLGFGYYKPNLERLGLGEVKICDSTLTLKYLGRYKFIDYKGTGVGLGMAERQSIEDDWRISVPDDNLKSLEFLKEYASFS